MTWHRMTSGSQDSMSVDSSWAVPTARSLRERDQYLEEETYHYGMTHEGGEFAGMYYDNSDLLGEDSRDQDNYYPDGFPEELLEEEDEGNGLL